jgi:hypothetical protein
MSDNWTRSSLSLSYASTFDAAGTQDIFVLGRDRKLWCEHAADTVGGTFGQVPPPREQVDGNVAAFRVGDDLIPIYVLGTDGNLWAERAVNDRFGQVPPPRTQIDGNVQGFQVIDDNNIYVVGKDGKLWLERGPFGQVPPPREQVDANVATFQALDQNWVYVLGSDGKLWLEQAPFGTVPPTRWLVDGNVAAFQAVLNGGDTTSLGRNNIYVLGTDGNLWLEHGSGDGPFGGPPPSRERVDGNVAAFQALDLNTVCVLGKDGNLWLEHSVNGKFGQVPPPREHVDGNVEDFQALDANTTYALGTDGKLWLEHSVNGKFGQVPPPREQVDANVMGAIAYGTLRPSYYILTVIYAPPGCNGGKSPTQVSYSASSATGTTTSTSKSFTNSVDISASVGGSVPAVGGGSVGADFSTSHKETDSSSVQITYTSTNSLSVSGPPAADGIDHDKDHIYICFNPLLSVAADRQNHVGWEFGIDGPDMIWNYVEPGWLKNPSLIPAGTKQQMDNAGITQSDYSQILSVDPFASGATAIDPKRYQLNTTLLYEPPEGPDDPSSTTGGSLSNSTTSTSTESAETDYKVSVSISGSWSLSSIVSATLKVTDSFEWTSTNTSTQTSQSIQTASTILGMPSMSWTGPTEVKVYWDTVYNSFMFAF